MSESHAQLSTTLPGAAARANQRRRFVAYGVLFVVLYVASCGAIAWMTVAPHVHPLGTTPASQRLPFRAVAFRSADGTRLAGWFIPASGKPRGLLVLCHGVDGTRLDMLGKARMLHGHGYSTLLFDFRGRGESAPSLCTIGYRETDDLVAALAYARELPGARGLPIAVLGESQGAAVAIMGAARFRDVAAVVAESPFACLDHAVDNHFRRAFGAWSPLVSTPVRWIGEALIRRRCCSVSPVAVVSEIRPRPILLIQDGDDVLCPPAETQELLRAAGPSATLWTVPHADHVMAEYVAPDEFERRVTEFLDTALWGAKR